MKNVTSLVPVPHVGTLIPSRGAPPMAHTVPPTRTRIVQAGVPSLASLGGLGFRISGLPLPPASQPPEDVEPPTVSYSQPPV